MWIVAVAWIYVVGLMAITEPNVVAGIMTFLVYCVLPLSILFYIAGSKRRRLRNDEAAAAPARQQRQPQPTAAAQTSALFQPDQAGQAAGDAVAPVRVKAVALGGGAMVAARTPASRHRAPAGSAPAHSCRPGICRAGPRTARTPPCTCAAFGAAHWPGSVSSTSVAHLELRRADRRPEPGGDLAGAGGAHRGHRFAQHASRPGRASRHAPRRPRCRPGRQTAPAGNRRSSPRTPRRAGWRCWRRPPAPAGRAARWPHRPRRCHAPAKSTPARPAAWPRTPARLRCTVSGIVADVQAEVSRRRRRHRRTDRC